MAEIVDVPETGPVCGEVIVITGAVKALLVDKAIPAEVVDWPKVSTATAVSV